MQNWSNKSKYYILMERLKEDILMGRIRPGEQIPSENILAEEYSLSRHTVRKAISILVNEGYLYTEHGRGTFCLDRARKRSISKNIGVITTYISEYIFPSIIQGIDEILSSDGYSILLKNTNNIIENEALFLQDMLGKDIEGLIIEPTKSVLFSSNIKFYDAFDSHHIPYIFINGYHQQLKSKSQVLIDDAAGMYSIVEYLAKLNHKKIIGIFKADDIQGLNRHRGYAKALTDAGLPYDPDDIIWYHTEDKDVKPNLIIKQLIEAKKNIDAIVCYNDQIAFDIYGLLTDMGVKVPEDISLTGFDDWHYLANSAVKLTTVSHPKEILGREAAEILLRMLKDDDYLNNPIQKMIVPELIIRDSCIQR